MAPNLEQLGLSQLSRAERLALAEALWDSVAGEAGAVPLTPTQHDELLRRAAAADADPHAGTPWEEIFNRAERESGA